MRKKNESESNQNPLHIFIKLPNKYFKIEKKEINWK